MMDETPTFQLTCDQIVCLMDGSIIHSFIAIIVKLDCNVKHPSTDPPTHMFLLHIF